MIDLQDITTAALVAHFEQAFAANPPADAVVAPVVEGWPDWEEEPLNGAGTVVSVHPVRHSEEWCAPTRKSHSAGTVAGTLDVLYCLGTAEVVFQVDVWAPYKSHLKQAAAVLSSALHNELPLRPGLNLQMADYHNARLHAYEASEVRTRTSSADAAAGEIRRTWELRARTELLAVGNTPALAVLQLHSTVQVGGVTLTYPVVEVP